jgi:hypothetical protein
MIESFSLLNVNFAKKGTGHWIFMNGEVMNNTNRTYTSVVFRLSVFEGQHILWSGPLKLRNFRRHSSRPFEVQLEKVEVDAAKGISRYEIFFETGY